MDKDKKQYIHFNPTQINNYGSGENSAQTISRKVKGAVDNPLETIDTISDGVNSLLVILFKSIPYFILTVVIPFAMCGALGFTLLYYTMNPDPNIAHLLSGSYDAIDKIFVLIPEMIEILTPLIIIFGCAILCLSMSSFAIAYLIYPDNARKRRNCFTALFGVQLGLFIHKQLNDDK